MSHIICTCDVCVSQAKLNITGGCQTLIQYLQRGSNGDPQDEEKSRAETMLMMRAISAFIKVWQKPMDQQKQG